MSRNEDSDLIERASAGDQAAFGELVERYASLVTGIAYSLCGDFVQSEDIGQEAFWEAWKSLPTLQDPGKFVAWLCTIARRRAVDAVRSGARSAQQSLDLLKHGELRDPKQLPPDTEMSQEQQHALVWSLLEKLPQLYREPMVLYYRSQQSTRDVALALNESEVVIRQRLSRGREMVRREATETLRTILYETAPKAAFAAVVLANLPGTAYAAAATPAALAAAGKSTGAGGIVSMILSSYVMGPLIGVMGGVLGTWMSWKNCEYERQRGFLLRQAAIYVAGMAVLGVLLASLVYLKLHGQISSNAMYGTLLISLIIGFQVLNIAWIIYGIRTYRRLGEQALQHGERMRGPARERLNRLKQATRVVHPGGEIKYEAFQWNAGAWFGSLAGAVAWMAPLGVLSIAYGSYLVGAVALACMSMGCLIAIVLWRSRDTLSAYHAYQIVLPLLFVMTVCIFATIQLFANGETLLALRWSKWNWLLLLIFPALLLQFSCIRRYHSRNMLADDSVGSGAN